MNKKKLLTGAVTGLWMVLIAGCGGSSSGGDEVSNSPRSIGGTASGLKGTLVLANNGGDALTLNSDGPFVFTSKLAAGTPYAVTIQTPPATQNCTLAHNKGTVGASDITNVQVSCVTKRFGVDGTISGLNGTVVLQNNGSDNVMLTGDGEFAFALPIAMGDPYNVTVLTQPAGQTCVVANGSGIIETHVDNVSVTCTANATTLSASVSDLALSVTGLTEYGVAGTPASGTPRQIIFTNTGIHPATNVSMNASSLPAGTSITSNTCSGTLNAGASCTITVTPGATATSDGTNPCSSGTAPVPATIQATADNANIVSTNVVVLSYACLWQGGYVYALDDTVSSGQSVAGKVATTSDQASPYPNGIIWSSNGNGGSAGDVVTDTIFGIAETSTTSAPDPAGGQVTGQIACNGAIDAACNTNNIYTYYQNNALNAPINLSHYAAGLCTQTIAGYSDWSLPAICDLGYGGTACGTSGSPAQQNMQTSLVDFNGASLIAGIYWSSTESSNFPNLNAWVHFFNSNGFQANQTKATTAGVRCSRAF